MDTGQTSLQAIAEELGAGPSIFYRMLLRRVSETLWRVHRLLIDAVPDEPVANINRSFRYNYGDVAAIAGKEEGRVAALWLTSTGQHTVQAFDARDLHEPFHFEMPSLTAFVQAASWRKNPSMRISEIGPLPWPSRGFNVNLQA